ncbi:MAG: ABC transporter permease [Propionibacteriaceae bacterium]|jgi:peptide/nickel transport system permease protein|nr:ABC transporter permease [Propionibacteriaceae bacterium]
MNQLLWKKIGLRLATLVGILFTLTILLFVLEEISGFDPAAVKVGANASPEAIQAERERMGLNDPILVRYVRYIGGVVQGDLGTSYRTVHAITDDIAMYLPASIEIVGFAFVLAVLGASFFAISSQLRWPGTSLVRGAMFVAYTTPGFLLALFGILLFYRTWKVFPASGRISDPDALNGPTGFFTIDALLAGRPDLFADVVSHLVLPGIALAAIPAVAIGRVLRSSLSQTITSDYIRTAQMKGLSEWRVLTRHVVRNSLPATLSMLGLQVGFMFSGLIVVEKVFSYPGIGLYMANALGVADFPAISGGTLVLGTIYVVSNTVVDFLQSAADPRVELA